jgi:hypothetical protein
MENLPPVHTVLKELCIPKHNTTLDYIILSELAMNYFEIMYLVPNLYIRILFEKNFRKS